MNILSLLYNLFIEPLQLLFEFIFSVSYKSIKDPGICIIILSIVMNLLALPLYYKAEMIQAEAKREEEKLAPMIRHIKDYFSGDERIMILQTYYDQNNYHPLMVLKSSISLMLQIPFFLAAYKMLSTLELLSGRSFGPIADLGSPDGLIVIGTVSVNLLPILMTVINLVASSIYLKDSDLKGKIQLYGIAAIFLVLLYNSPSGLVFYWTCNNIFSLVKNLIPKKASADRREKIDPVYSRVFFLDGLFIAFFVGLFIPSVVIRSSPLQFTDPFCLFDPSVYLLDSLSLAIGSFVLWSGILFYMSSAKIKRVLSVGSLIISIVFFIDYSFFKIHYGDLAPGLIFKEPDMGIDHRLLGSILMILVVSLAVYYIHKTIWKYAVCLSASALIFAAVLGVYNVKDIKSQYYGFVDTFGGYDYATIKLSENERNVVIIMLDKAVGYAVPYIFNELPYLEEQFDGFTYYPNTLSFGGHTNLASPALYGGYDYIPSAINERSDELLVDKHNEALKVMPAIFNENGFEVTLCDPSFAGYSEVPDLSVFDDYPQINTFITNGRYNPMKEDEIEDFAAIYERNLFCYSILRVMPVPLHELLYDDGFYNYPDGIFDRIFTPVFSSDGNKMMGYDPEFMNSFTVLDSLPEMTDPEVTGNGTFTLLVNYTAHTKSILSEPDYLPDYFVDNTEYNAAHADRFVVDGQELAVTQYYQYGYYSTNAAAYIQLGEWFDYLREQGVYDNTRIIVVSDHGYNYSLMPSWKRDNFSSEYYNPVLMVKDFDSHGFFVSEEFMTNADTPAIAFEGLIDDPVNPFTGSAINSDYKYDNDDLLVFDSDVYSVNENHGNTFVPGPWYTVHDDMRVIDNWEFVGVW